MQTFLLTFFVYGRLPSKNQEKTFIILVLSLIDFWIYDTQTNNSHALIVPSLVELTCRWTKWIVGEKEKYWASITQNTKKSKLRDWIYYTQSEFIFIFVRFEKAIKWIFFCKSYLEYGKYCQIVLTM